MEKQVQFSAPLAIDELVKSNTTAKQKMESTFRIEEFYPYNFKFTKLKKNLEKFI